MAVFAYKAMNPDGQLVRGELEAAKEDIGAAKRGEAPERTADLSREVRVTRSIDRDCLTHRAALAVELMRPQHASRRGILANECPGRVRRQPLKRVARRTYG